MPLARPSSITRWRWLATDPMDIAAAMEIQQRGIGGGPRRRRPFSGHAAGIDRGQHRVGGGGKLRPHAVVHGAKAFDAVRALG